MEFDNQPDRTAFNLPALSLAAGLLLFAAHLAIARPALDDVLPVSIYEFGVKLGFESFGGDVQLATYLPASDERQTLLQENIDSGDLAFDDSVDAAGRSGKWSGRPAEGLRSLRYTAQLSIRGVRYEIPPGLGFGAVIGESVKPYLEETEAIPYRHPEIRALWSKIRPSESVGLLQTLQTIFRYTHETLEPLPFSGYTDALTALRLGQASCNGKSRLFIALARLNNIPARLVGGVILEPGVKRTSHQWVEVHIGGHWVPFDPLNGHFAEIPARYLVLYRGDEILFSHTPDINFDYSFRVRQLLSIPADTGDTDEAAGGGWLANLARFLRLNRQVSEIFLLFPLAALVVTFFRSVTGLRTFGTFLPMLVAAGCRYTGLLEGLAGFVMILGAGAATHRLFRGKQVPRVSRVAAVVTVLTALTLVAAALLSENVRRQVALLALFPVVILSFAAERLHQMVERGDFRELATTLAMTVAVTAACYFAFSSVLMRSLFFSFPELLFVVLAVQLAVGHWTGRPALDYPPLQTLLGEREPKKNRAKREFRDVAWYHNGIALTTIALALAGTLYAAEWPVIRHSAAPLTVAIGATGEPDDESDDADRRPETVPLYASLLELEAEARRALADRQAAANLLYELGRQARGFRAYELADRLFARCLEQAPRHTDALFLRARTLSDLERRPEALRLYEALLALAPNHQKATYNLGVLVRRSGDTARAEQVLSRAVAISSGRLKAKALHQLGQTFRDEGRLDRAEETLRQSINLRPDAFLYWLDLGSVLRMQNRSADALTAFQKALALNSQSDEVHTALGRFYEREGNRAKALYHLQRAVGLDTDNAGSRKALARLYLADGDSRHAREEFGWLARNAEGDADRVYAEAMLALLDQDFDRMLAHLKQADALHPGAYDEAIEQAAAALHEHKQDEKARALLGTLLARASLSASAQLSAARTAVKLEQWSGAEKLLRRCLQSEPDRSEAWFLLGRVLSERGDTTGAIEAYRKNLVRNPDARNAKLNLAVLYARSGSEREALALYTELLQANPRYVPALINRALLHERAGRVPEAMSDFESAQAAAPGDPDVRRRFAQLLLRNGRQDRALELLTEVVGETPADMGARLLLAEAELRSGDRSAAARDLRRAAALAGNDPSAWRRLAQLFKESGDAQSAILAEARAAEHRPPAPTQHPAPPP